MGFLLFISDKLIIVTWPILSPCIVYNNWHSMCFLIVWMHNGCWWCDVHWGMPHSFAYFIEVGWCLLILYYTPIAAQRKYRLWEILGSAVWFVLLASVFQGHGSSYSLLACTCFTGECLDMGVNLAEVLQLLFSLCCNIDHFLYCLFHFVVVYYWISKLHMHVHDVNFIFIWIIFPSSIIGI